MAYADGIRDSEATMDDVGDLLEGLLGSYSSAGSGAVSTASTSYTAVGTTTVTLTVATGEFVFICATASASHSSADQTVDFIVHKDGVGITNPAYATSNSATSNGANQSVCLMVAETPSAGSHTYALKYKVAAGTGYSASSQIVVLKFRIS